MTSSAPFAEMRCQELVEVITEYLEGTIDERDRLRFEAHLAECDACEEYLTQMRRTIATVGRVSVESLSADARTDLLRAFRSWRAA